MNDMTATASKIQPSISPAIDNEAPVRWRWTREQYYRFAELFHGRRVQLIEGEVYEMAPQRNDHAIAIELAVEVLRNVFSQGYRVRTQLPLRLEGDSEPEPDIAIIKGFPRGQREHPEGALLVVEVSDSTLHFDRTRKIPLYAKAGIQEYWIINLVSYKVEVHRHATQEPNGEYRYDDIHSAGKDEFLSPLASPNAKIAVADLLP